MAVKQTTMKKVIYKYKLEQKSLQHIEMATGSQILCAQLQGEDIYIWALFDPEPENGVETRTIEIMGTGDIRRDMPRAYISTVQINRFVWHVFELTQK